MFKLLTFALSFLAISMTSAQAQQEIFSCKEEYISDYNEHILTATKLTKESDLYRLTIIDQAQLSNFFNTLYSLQIKSVYSLDIIFSKCNFDKAHTWELNCGRPLFATFYDNQGKEIGHIAELAANSGRFTTNEENKNWFFSSLALHVNNKFAEIKAQYHPEENCTSTQNK